MDFLTEYLITGVPKFDDGPACRESRKYRALDWECTGYVREMQKMLLNLGYREVGMIDGIPGPRFLAALEHYRFDRASP